MADIYINATRFEAELKKMHDIAIDQGYCLAARTYENIIAMLRSQAGFECVEVMERKILDDMHYGIHEEALKEMIKEEMSHDLGEYAVKQGYAKIAFGRDRILHDCNTMTLHAAFLIPEQPKLRSPKEGAEDGNSV